MKFLIDIPLSPELAQWLRTEGHDVVHANELSMNRVRIQRSFTPQLVVSASSLRRLELPEAAGRTWFYWTGADSAAGEGC